MTSQRAQRLLGKMGPGLNLTSANEQLHTLEKTLYFGFLIFVSEVQVLSVFIS